MKMRETLKRFISFCLGMVLLLTAVPVSVPAKAVDDNWAAASGSFYGRAYAGGYDLWKQNVSSSLKNGPPPEVNPVGDAILEDSWKLAIEHGKAQISQYLTMALQKQLIKNGVTLNGGPQAEALLREISYLNDKILNSKNLNKIADLLKIRDAKYLQISNLKAGNKAMLKGAGKLVGGVFAIYSVWDWAMNPELGYNSPYMEFGANVVRGMSTASGFLLPGVGPLVFAGLEFAVTSKLGVMFGNWLDKKIQSTKIGKGITWGLNKCSDGFNYLGQKGWEWSPLWILWYDVPRWKQEVEAAWRLHQAKSAYEQKHGSPFVKGAKGATATANNVGVYKPNIYLYPEQETEFRVTFARPELLTVSDPLYPGGWQGTAYPDGTLSVNGEAYGFLFYESLTDERYYQREAGFVIPVDNREAVFTEILSGYGLNTQEIADFCEFWCEKLESGRDYAMYPQMTETVDAAMPVTVTPVPDSVLRIWFAFAEDEIPVVRAEPEPFTRKGMSAVEWGGFFFSPNPR